MSSSVVLKNMNMLECHTHTDFFQLIKELKEKKIIIYGAGKIGERVYRFFSHFGIPVSFFWDAKAELIREVENVPVLKPDFQQISPEDRKRYFIIVTVFSENICHMIQNTLLEAGFYNTVIDREFVNSLIYFKCKTDVQEKMFQFNLNTCFFCPYAKGGEQRCEIFNDYVKTNLINGASHRDHKNGLVIPSMGVLISTRCTLNCKGCNHLREYYKPSNNFDIEASRILDDLGSVLDAVKFINTLVIVGGESFLHKDFENIIDQVLRLPKIGIVQIITNGTVVPKNERVFELLSNPRVIVEISGYGKKIPKELQNNIKLFIEKNHKFQVNYRYTEQMQWFDFGEFEERGYSKKELARVYSSCICVSNDLFDGKLHKCSRSAFGTYLGKTLDFPSDYVDVRGTPKEEMGMKLAEFLGKKYAEACRFCNGTSTVTIEAGQQVGNKEKCETEKIC